MKKNFDRLFKIKAVDPDDYRRRRLVSILLSGMVGLAVFLLIMVASLFLLDSEEFSGAGEIIVGLLSIASFTLLSGGIFWLNRVRSGTLAAWIFLLLLLVTVAFADSPREMVDGRSLYLFVLPILMSSFVLFPWASFIFSGFSSVVLLLLTYGAELPVPNFFGMVGFFAIAFVSWLASNSMEKALKDLRILNRELDQRVEERTRELAEALIRESAEAGKNQAILDGIADGVVVFDAGGKMIVANPSVCRLLDTSRKALLGKTINEFVTLGQLPDSETKKLHEMLVDPERDSLSARVIWGEKTLSITTAAVITQLGRSIGTVAVVRDFTREAEVERMKNTFVAMVSHELRTPLNAILAYSEMIQGGVYGPVNAEQDKAAGRIFTNTQRLIGLVSDLLDEARLEAGKMKIDVAEFSIIEAIDSMRGVMEKPAKDKGLALNIIVSGTTPKKIWGDSNRYQQIIINLVNNAVKFTKSGKVLVKVTGVDENQWQLEVSDTGPGIPEDALPHIFDTFRQVDGLATRQHGGAGLGLSIVKRLVDLMGGAIKVTSVVGVGTTFTLLFPVQMQENEQGATL
jgi:PAS domain S-box-containing protein